VKKIIIELSKTMFYDVEVVVPEENNNINEEIEKVASELTAALQESGGFVCNGFVCSNPSTFGLEHYRDESCVNEICSYWQKHWNGISEVEYLGYEEATPRDILQSRLFRSE